MDYDFDNSDSYDSDDDSIGLGGLRVDTDGLYCGSDW